MLPIQLEMDEMVSGYPGSSFRLRDSGQHTMESETVFIVIHRVFILVVLTLLVVWLVLDTSQRPEQLISCGGVCMFILLLFVFSAHRTAVSFDSNETCFEISSAVISPVILGLFS